MTHQRRDSLETYVADIFQGSEVGFAFAASLTIDLNDGDHHSATSVMNDDCAITIENCAIGRSGSIIFQQDGSGGHAITSITADGFTVLLGNMVTGYDDPNAIFVVLFTTGTVVGVPYLIVRGA